MYASIFKANGNRFELVIHDQANLSGESVQAQLYFASKAEAKAEAKRLGLTAWNY